MIDRMQLGKLGKPMHMSATATNPGLQAGLIKPLPLLNHDVRRFRLAAWTIDLQRFTAEIIRVNNTRHSGSQIQMLDN